MTSSRHQINHTIYELTEAERLVMKKLIDMGLVVRIGDHEKAIANLYPTSHEKEHKALAMLGLKHLAHLLDDPEVSIKPQIAHSMSWQLFEIVKQLEAMG